MLSIRRQGSMCTAMNPEEPQCTKLANKVGVATIGIAIFAYVFGYFFGASSFLVTVAYYALAVGVCLAFLDTGIDCAVRLYRWWRNSK